MKKLQARKPNKSISVIHKVIQKEVSIIEPQSTTIVEEDKLETSNEYGITAPIPEPTPIEETGITVDTKTEEITAMEEEIKPIPVPVIKRDKASKKKNSQDDNKETKKEE